MRAQPPTDDKGYMLRDFYDGQDVVIDAVLKPGAAQVQERGARGCGTPVGR